MLKYFFRESLRYANGVVAGRRELDAGIWRMAIEPAVGLCSIRLHESPWLQFRKITSGIQDSVPLSALLLMNILLRCLPYILIGNFLQRVCQQAGFSPMIIREVVEPQTVLAMISMGIGITLMADGYAQNELAGCGVPSLKGTYSGGFVYWPMTSGRQRASAGETGGGVDGMMSVPDGD